MVLAVLAALVLMSLALGATHPFGNPRATTTIATDEPSTLLLEHALSSGSEIGAAAKMRGLPFYANALAMVRPFCANVMVSGARHNGGAGTDESLKMGVSAG